MAKIDYRYGLVSLVSDLTSASSAVEPVAIIGTGHETASHKWHVFAIVPADLERRPSISSDPIAATVLANLMQLLRDRIDAARAEKVPPGDLLPWMSDQLQSNLRLSWIRSRRKTLPSVSPSTLIGSPIREFFQYLFPANKTSPKKSVRKASRKTAARKLTPSGRPNYVFEPVSNYSAQRQAHAAHAGQ